MISTMLASSAVGVGTQVAGQVQGQVQGMASNMVNSVVGNVTGSVSSFISSLGNRLFGSSTGANKVWFTNKRNKGDKFFHGQTVGGKQYAIDYVLKTMTGKDINQLVFQDKLIGDKLEDKFWEVLKPYLDRVIAGTANFPEAFDDDPIILAYLGNHLPNIQAVSGKEGLAQTPVKTSTTPVKITALDNAISKADSLVKANKPAPTTKKTGSFPWWTLFLLGL